MCGDAHPLLRRAPGAGYGPVMSSYEHIIEPSLNLRIKKAGQLSVLVNISFLGMTLLSSYLVGCLVCWFFTDSLQPLHDMKVNSNFFIFSVN